MPLNLQQLRQRLHLELRSMPPGVARIAADGFYSLMARQRDTYPLDGCIVFDEIIMECSSYWLDGSADPVSEAVRLSTLDEVQDWVRWIEAQIYETAVVVAREAVPELDDPPNNLINCRYCAPCQIFPPTCSNTN